MKIGIIGGSGLDKLDILENAQEQLVDTEYGSPSSPVTTGTINGVSIALLARHGRDHRITPTNVNNRANIQALKNLGCTHILATTACGSLREDIKRGDFVILDQFIDFTRLRTLSFDDEFPNGGKHTAMADPFDETIRNCFLKTAANLEIPHHKSGTVITIEGNRFSTRAESRMFRMWGADVINMSISPECILANEAQIPYGAIAMSTDYDCWKEDEKPVSWEEILSVFSDNVEKVTQLLINTVAQLKSGE